MRADSRTDRLGLAVLVASAFFALAVFGWSAAGRSRPASASAAGAPAGACEWAIVTTPNVETYNAYHGITALSATDIWAAGASGPSFAGQHTLIAHWDGSTWNTVPSPDGGPDRNNITAIDAVASNDIWAVGSYNDGQIGGTSRSMALHWDGSAWTIVSTPNPAQFRNELYGVTALSATDVWAVGYTWQAAGVYSTLVMHWDGTSWSTVPSANPAAANYLMAVDAVSPANIWAVGYYLAPGNTYQTLIEHWDGMDWTVIPSPIFTSTQSYLTSVSAVSATDAWAVGYTCSGSCFGGAAGQPLVLHWDGTMWSVVPLPPYGGDAGSLRSVLARSSTDVWAAGGYVLSSNNYYALMMHWDGIAWTVVPSPRPQWWSPTVNGLDAPSTGDVWAAGEFHYPGDPVIRTLAERYVCPSGTPTATPATPTPTACPVGSYVIATGTATMVPGTVDTGNHCDECITTIPLPFPYDLYDQAYTQVGLDSNGRAVFGAGSIWHKCIPVPGHTYTIYPYWDDLVTSQQSGCPPGGCGIFTSTSGVAPNRIFNIEWRAVYFDPPSQQANFELRLYEGQTRFDVIYGSVDQGNIGAIAGVQKDGSNFTPYFCWGSGGQASGSTTYTLASTCPTPGPTSTHVPPGATPTTTPSPTAPANTPVPVTPSPTATATSTATPTACSVQFDDMPPDHTFYPFVRCLACQGIVSGYECGGTGEPCDPSNNPYFRPNNPVTRGQLAKIVSESAGFDEEVPPSQWTFTDVPYGSTFWEWIERLANREVMAGYACGSDPNEPCDSENRPYFRPGAGATRGQLTKIVSNAAGFDDTIPPTQYTFTDVQPSHTFWLFVERLLLNRPDVMGGYPCGGPGEPCETENRPYFRPNNSLTRGQTSKIVAVTFFPGCNPAGR